MRLTEFQNIRLGLVAACLGLALLAAPARADTAGENKAIVEAAFKAWAEGTGSPFDLLADEADWTIEGYSGASRTYPSKVDFFREVIGPFNARMTQGIRPAVRSVTAQEDRVVILFDAAGLARDGKTYTNTYAWFFEMKGGQVVKASAFFDPAVFNDLWARVPPAE